MSPSQLPVLSQQATSAFRACLVLTIRSEFASTHVVVFESRLDVGRDDGFPNFMSDDNFSHPIGITEGPRPLFDGVLSDAFG